MSCNCKRKIELEKKYGIKEEENVLQKTIRFTLKLFFMVLAISFALVIIPIMVVVSLFKAFFGNNEITLPNFLGKYLKKTDE